MVEMERAATRRPAAGRTAARKTGREVEATTEVDPRRADAHTCRATVEQRMVFLKEGKVCAVGDEQQQQKSKSETASIQLSKLKLGKRFQGRQLTFTRIFKVEHLQVREEVKKRE